MRMPLFHKDRMETEERLNRLLSGQNLDRIPFVTGAFSFNCLNVGYSINDWYTNMQKAFDACKWTSEQYHALWIPMAGYPAIGPWELGGEIKWPAGEWDQCPNTLPAVNNEEEAWKIELPNHEFLKQTGYIPYLCEFAKIASSQGLPYSLTMYCPWTTAGNIVGTERLCRWAIKKPDLVHHLVKTATDFLIRVYEIIFEDVGSAKNCFVSNSTASASNDLISPRHFKTYALPYLIEYHSRLIDMGVAGFSFHICGDQNANYPFLRDVPLTPVSMISVSHEVDLATASRYFPDHIIMGNVEPAILQMGTPRQVYEATCSAIEKGMTHNRGFILAPGCELPPRTPPYNLWMMAKAVNDHGYFN